MKRGANRQSPNANANIEEIKNNQKDCEISEAHLEILKILRGESE